MVIDLVYYISIYKFYFILFRRMEETRMKKRDQYNFKIRLKWNALRRNNPDLPAKVPKWYKDKFQTTWKYGIHPALPIFVKPRDNRFHYTKTPKPG